MIDHSDALADPTRLERLADYDLDAPELTARLDALASRTAQRLGLPIALVSLVMDSAQLLVGASGLEGSWLGEARGTPVEWSFCATTVVMAAPYLVFDAAQDPFQHDNPLVTIDGVGAYAGVPLRSADGQVLGATCALNTEAHVFSETDLAHLEAASLEATAILEEYRAAR